MRVRCLLFGLTSRGTGISRRVCWLLRLHDIHDRWLCLGRLFGGCWLFLRFNGVGRRRPGVRWHFRKSLSRRGAHTHDRLEVLVVWAIILLFGRHVRWIGLDRLTSIAKGRWRRLYVAGHGGEACISARFIGFARLVLFLFCGSIWALRFIGVFLVVLILWWGWLFRRAQRGVCICHRNSWSAVS